MNPNTPVSKFWRDLLIAVLVLLLFGVVSKACAQLSPGEQARIDSVRQGLLFSPHWHDSVRAGIPGTRGSRGPRPDRRDSTIVGLVPSQTWQPYTRYMDRDRTLHVTGPRTRTLVIQPGQNVVDSGTRHVRPRTRQDWTRETTGNFTRVYREADFTARLSRHGTTWALYTGTDTIVVRVNATEVAATLTRDTLDDVRVANPWIDTETRTKLTPEGIEQLIIRQTVVAPDQWTFTVTGSDTLQANNGALTRGTLQLAAAGAWDSGAVRQWTPSIAVGPMDAQRRQTVTVIGNTPLDAIYPVTIDPTVTIRDSTQGAESGFLLADITTLTLSSASGGSNSNISIRNNGGSLRRMMFWFNYADSLPAGSIIDSARVILTCSTNVAYGDTITVSRVKTAGGQDTLAHTLQAKVSWNNWNQGAGLAWSTAGGDTVRPRTTAFVSKNVTGAKDYALVTADVQGVVDGSWSNLGWIFSPTGSEGTDQTQWGAVGGLLTNRPVLEIYWQPGADADVPVATRGRMRFYGTGFEPLRVGPARRVGSEATRRP